MLEPEADRVVRALTGYRLLHVRLVLLLAIGGALGTTLRPLSLGARTVGEAPLLAVLLLLAAAADLELRLVPNRLLFLGSTLALTVGVCAGDLPVRLQGAGAVVLVLLLARALGRIGWGRPGVGMGDVKLGGMVGLFLGGGALWALYLAVLAGGVGGACMLAFGSHSKGATLPFAPFLAAGVACAGDVFPFERVVMWVLP